TSMATSQLMMRAARSFAPASPACSSAPENIGTKAVLKAPSANSRRNRLGKRKAAKKASAAGAVPSTAAISASRTKPATRLISVSEPTETKLRNRLMPPPSAIARPLVLGPLENAHQRVVDLLLAGAGVDLLPGEVGDVEDVHRLFAIGADMGRADGEAEIGDFPGEGVKQADAVEARDLDDGEFLRDGVGDRGLGRHLEGPQAPVVARDLAQVDEHLALALEQLPDRVDDAGGADLLVLVGGEGAPQAEGVDGAAVAAGEDLRADDRGVLHGAGPGDEREQARMVGRVEADLGDALEGPHPYGAGKGLGGEVGGADHAGVLDLQFRLGAQPVMVVMARHIG